MGAKNHAVVLPDADVDATVKAIAGASFGAAGQRCMAISAAVFVGGFERWREPLLEAARSLRVDGGFEPGADVGPMISREAKARAEAIIQKSECLLVVCGVLFRRMKLPEAHSCSTLTQPLNPPPRH